MGEGWFSKSKSKGLFPEEVEMDISRARITEDSIAMFSVLMSPFHKWLKELESSVLGSDHGSATKYVILLNISISWLSQWIILTSMILVSRMGKDNSFDNDQMKMWSTPYSLGWGINRFL